MSSIPQALMWETAARGKWSIPLFFLVGNLFPFFLYSAFAADNLYFDATDGNGLLIQFAMIPYSVIIFALGVVVAQGESSRLYAAPMSTARMVAWHMFPGAAIIGLQTIATAWTLNSLYRVHWSVASTGLVAMTAWCASHLLWHTSRRTFLGSCLLLLPTALVFGGWTLSRWEDPMDNYFPLQVIVMLAVIVAAYFWTIAGVARDRCGESWMDLGVIAWIKNRFDLVSTKAERVHAFGSKTMAQNWLQWRTNVLLLPTVYGIIVICVGTIWLVGNLVTSNRVHVSSTPENVTIPLGTVAALIAVLSGVAMGTSRGSLTKVKSERRRLGDQGDFSISSFEATLPITSADLARALLLAALFSSFLAVLIWGSFVAAVMSLATGWSPWTPIYSTRIELLAIMVVLLGPWVLMTNTAVLGLTGRRSVLAAILTMGVACYGLSIYAVGQYGSIELQRSVNSILGVALFCSIIAGTLLAFVQALRRSMLGKWSFVLAIAISLAVAWAPHCFGVGSTSVVASLWDVAFAALVVAPVATAPLAIDWNRHR